MFKVVKVSDYKVKQTKKGWNVLEGKKVLKTLENEVDAVEFTKWQYKMDDIANRLGLWKHDLVKKSTRQLYSF